MKTPCRFPTGSDAVASSEGPAGTLMLTLNTRQIISA